LAIVPFLLTPRWLALHIGVIAVVVACVLLGQWQLRSYGESERRQAANRAMPPVALAELAAPGRGLPADALGRPVVVSGRYDASEQLLVLGRERNGRTGFHVVTPLLTDEGGAMPVNRGWVGAADDPAVRAPGGAVTVTGVLQPSETERDSRVDPLTQLPAGQVPFIATADLVGRLPYGPDRLYDGNVVLTAESPAPAAAPAPVEPRSFRPGGVSPWRNLSYGLQWYVFAAAAVAFWAITVRAALRDRRGRTQAPEPAEV
jgi:cytochrome oxidase assembly protein ShyY1